MEKPPAKIIPFKKKQDPKHDSKQEDYYQRRWEEHEQFLLSQLPDIIPSIRLEIEPQTETISLDIFLQCPYCGQNLACKTIGHGKSTVVFPCECPKK